MYLELFHNRVDVLIVVNVLLELVQSGCGQGHAFIASSLDLLVGEYMTVEQELAKEFMSVVHPQVGIVLI